MSGGSYRVKCVTYNHSCYHSFIQWRRRKKTTNKSKILFRNSAIKFICVFWIKEREIQSSSEIKIYWNDDDSFYFELIILVLFVNLNIFCYVYCSNENLNRSEKFKKKSVMGNSKTKPQQSNDKKSSPNNQENAISLDSQRNQTPNLYPQLQIRNCIRDEGISNDSEFADVLRNDGATCGACILRSLEIVCENFNFVLFIFSSHLQANQTGQPYLL